MTLVEHQLSDTKPDTLFKQLCHCSVFSSFLKQIWPQADLKDQLTAKNAIRNHEYDLEAGNTTDQSQGT